MIDVIKDYFENHKEEMLNDISSLISIPSVRGEKKDGKPYGEMPYAALQKALSISESYGFSCKDYDGYAGAVDYNNKETVLNIFAHLDVVEAGSDWITPPYEMTLKKDVVYGRGVSDDKGPAVCALYAMRALKESGIQLNKNVRLIFGTDEECGCSDLKYYFSKEKPSEWSFTPDANFPVTNGEKGRFSKNFFSEYEAVSEGCFVKSVHAGVAGNAVPSVCEAEVTGIADEKIAEYAKSMEVTTGTSFSVNNGKIVCRGTSAHASLPFMGNNPVTAMLALLSSLPVDDSECSDRIKALCEMFSHGDYKGKSFGVDMEDSLGELTLSLDILHLENGKIHGFFDTRTPMKASAQNCSSVIEDVLNENGFVLDDNKLLPAHYVDENSPFIKTLLKNYQLFTGEKGECISMGGGTYVHNVEGGVAFGAIKKGVNSKMHGANEFMPVEDLITAGEIYAAVIYDMCK